MADDIKSRMKQYAGAGFEDMQGQDFGVPFLYICQANSPQLLAGNQLYIEAARPGKIFNTQTGAVYSDITIIVINYTFRYVEWKPREAGGGWVASYRRTEEPKDITIDPATNRQYRPNGNVIVQTSYYFTMVKEDKWNKAIVPMYSTQLKHSRRLNTMMIGKTMDDGKIAPIFSYFYHLSTTQEKNNKGVWYGWKIDPAGEVNDISLFNMAAEAHDKQVNFLPERLIAQINGGDDKDVM